MGDDIDIWNIGAYYRRMMAGRASNLELAAKGMLSIDTAPRRVDWGPPDFISWRSKGLQGDI